MAIRSITGFCAVVAGVAMAPTAQAGNPLDELLTVDLSVPNQVTITGTTGLSAATRSGLINIGVYLDGFFLADGFDFYDIANPGTTLSNVGNPADCDPVIYRGSGTDLGLNFYSWSEANAATFTAGTRAFAGTVTWSVTSEVYAQLLAGNSSGNLYFPASYQSQLGNATLIGTWRAVPTPGAAALLGLGGLALGRRRR